MCTPIPAKHIMSFSKMHESFKGIIIPNISILFICFGDIFQRRPKYDSQLIFTFTKYRFDIIFPDTVHILGMSYITIIKIDICNRIQSFKFQIYVCIPVCSVVHKRAFIFIFFFHQCTDRILIILPIRILNLMISQ